jgi:hypothetical protein
MTARDGGPAYPVSHTETRRDGSIHSQKWDGMSLRDAFAIAALQTAQMMWQRANERHDSFAPISISKCAFEIADAMLAAREARDADK